MSNYDTLLELMKKKNFKKPIPNTNKLSDDKINILLEACDKGIDPNLIYNSDTRKSSVKLLKLLADSLINQVPCKYLITHQKIINDNDMETIYNAVLEEKKAKSKETLIHKRIDLEIARILYKNEKNNGLSSLSQEQLNEINLMKTLGVDTKKLKYENKKIDVGILRQIRLGYEHGIDPTVYYRRGHKLRYEQCEQIRLALEDGLDPSSYNNIKILPKIMYQKRMVQKYVPENISTIAKFSNIDLEQDPYLRILCSLKEVSEDTKLFEKVLVLREEIANDLLMLIASVLIVNGITVENLSDTLNEFRKTISKCNFYYDNSEVEKEMSSLFLKFCNRNSKEAFSVLRKRFKDDILNKHNSNLKYFYTIYFCK